ncbi:MAG: hypothetical protein NTZ40_10700 [Cyanobacteria bacterium]|nr:hypothetical protein [Cyanobacteriota bacterium]
MIPPLTAVLNRLLFSAWRLALLAGLLAGVAEFYIREIGTS